MHVYEAAAGRGYPIPQGIKSYTGIPLLLSQSSVSRP